MKNIFKHLFAVFAAMLMLFSFSTNAFAKNWHFTRGRYNASIYEYSVALNTKGTQKITINSCSVPYDIQINGIYKGTIYPAAEANKKKKAEYTFAFKILTDKYGNPIYNKMNVLLQARKTGSHTFRIKTTGFNDTITKVR